ncbi:MAG: aldo/keto reductase [Planctomycetota bacterium]
MSTLPPASKLVLGTAAIGLDYGRAHADGQPARKPDDRELLALLKAVRGLGVHCYDTAPVYGDAEQRLGRLLQRRERVWTKLDPGLHPAASLEGSCARLQRRPVDLLQWHSWSAGLLHDNVFLDSWSELVHLGDASAFGASTYGADDALEAVDCGCFSVLQVEWNLLDQHVIAAVGPKARTRKVQLAVRSVWLQGLLAGRQPPNAGLAAAVQRAGALAQRLQRPLPALALQAALEHPQIDHVLIGCDRAEQVAVVHQALKAPPLDTEAWQAIWQLHVGPPATDPRTWA